VTVTSTVSNAAGGTVHGVVSSGAQPTSNWAVTTDEPGATARKTAVADVPDGAYERPSRTEPLEIIGAAEDQAPYPLHQPWETNVTVRLAPVRTQVAALDTSTVIDWFPAEQTVAGAAGPGSDCPLGTGRVTGVVDGTVVSAECAVPSGPVDTVRSTAVPWVSEVPPGGFDPMTVPAANVVLEAEVIVPTANPALPSASAAWACMRPTTFGTATDPMGEVVVDETGGAVVRLGEGRK